MDNQFSTPLADKPVQKPPVPFVHNDLPRLIPLIHQKSESGTNKNNFAAAVRLPVVFLRIGLAFVYIYAAVTMALNPDSFAHYLPGFIKELQILPVTTMLHIFGVYEIILSLWLLSGKWALYPSILATLTMYALTAVNLDSFSIVFRNVAIFSGGLALVALEWEKLKQK